MQEIANSSPRVCTIFLAIRYFGDGDADMVRTQMEMNNVTQQAPDAVHHACVDCTT